jgi:hypothetical protein
LFRGRGRRRGCGYQRCRRQRTFYVFDLATDKLDAAAFGIEEDFTITASRNGRGFAELDENIFAIVADSNFRGEKSRQQNCGEESEGRADFHKTR